MKKIQPYSNYRQGSFRNLVFAIAIMLGSGFAILETSCTTSSPRREVAPGMRVSIMSYNVENLFDTVKDENREDWTYLPLSEKSNPKVREACEKVQNDFWRKQCLEEDWNEDVLNTKLNRLADVIQQVGDGRGPDIQILVEVENKNALEMLRKKLSNSGYVTSVLLEGPDTRGIDTAVLSRLPEWDKPRLHIIPFKPKKGDEETAKLTRGILETRLKLPDGQKLSVFSVHFPSQSNPSYLRKQASEHLNTLKKKLPKDVLAIAGGDFNISSEEDQELGYYKRTLADVWLVSHQIGCQECKGTHYYHPKRSWSFLDALLFSPAMSESGSADWKVDPHSIRIPNDSRYQVNQYGSPERFNPKSATGVADHWPVYGEIYNPKKK